MQLSRDRLAKLLALLSSDRDGEALNAARTASRMVLSAGLTWADVLEGRTVGDASPVPDQAVRGTFGATMLPPIGRRWLDTVHRLVADRAWTSMYERELLNHIAGKLARLDGAHPLSAAEAAFVTATYQRWCKQEPEA